MSKELQDKILEAGIVPKNAVSQMEQWRTMPEGSAEKVGEFDPKKVRALAEDLELERLPDVKETILDIGAIMAKGREVNVVKSGMAIMGVFAGVDILGRYFIPIPENVDRQHQWLQMLKHGTTLVDNELEEPRNNRTITSVQILWSRIEKNKNAPTHWMVETRSEGEDHIVRGR